jgi:hypothetical protein
MGGRDPKAGQVLDGLVRGVGRDRGGEPALAEAEGSEPRQLGARLNEEVDAGDAEVGDAVTDELDHVVGPDEQDVEVEVADAGDEAPIVLVKDEAGVMQEIQRRLDEAALVRYRQPQSLPHRSFRTG